MDSQYFFHLPQVWFQDARSLEVVGINQTQDEYLEGAGPLFLDGLVELLQSNGIGLGLGTKRNDIVENQYLFLSSHIFAAKVRTDASLLQKYNLMRSDVSSKLC